MAFSEAHGQAFCGVILPVSSTLLSDVLLCSFSSASFSTSLSSRHASPAVLSDLLCCPSPPVPPPPGGSMHAHTCTHTDICPPPWSPRGFKVLILIRFELTYCQSSFSCSSETIESYHQDLDLACKLLCCLVPIVSPQNKNERPFAGCPSWSVSQQVSCSIKRHLKRGPCGQGSWQPWEMTQVLSLPPGGSVWSGPGP